MHVVKGLQRVRLRLSSAYRWHKR
eukprot:COSAG02_NODE_46168_length_351_cov_0.801587_1_plen_23_part_10